MKTNTNTVRVQNNDSSKCRRKVTHITSIASLALSVLASTAFSITLPDGFVTPESVSVGTSLDLDQHAAEVEFLQPQTQGMIEIVGMAIAKSNDHVYTWFADGRVCSGWSKDLDYYTALTPFTCPNGQTPSNIVGIGIASNDTVITWYKNRTFSIGTSTNLVKHSLPLAFDLPPGETVENLIGIDIASDDRVYSWYKNGKRSVGTMYNLGAFSAPTAFQLPPGQKISHVVDMAIAGNDRVYTWFQDMEHGVAWPAVANAVDQIIVDKLREVQIAGATVAISKNGRIVLDRAYGYRNVDTQEARMPWQRSKIGSVSKVITALGVVKHAQESSSFSLNSKVYGSNGALKDIAYAQAMVQGIQRHKPVVGFAISQNDRVYAWYENQTVSSGTTHNLTANSAPQPYTLPPGKTPNDILGIAINSIGAVYTWYIDGTRSIGTPTNLGQTSFGEQWEADRGASGILAIAIRKSDDRVHAWYDDGTLSTGNSLNLKANTENVAFTVPPGYTPWDLHDADFSASGVAYFHFGTKVSAGTATNLDSSAAPYASTGAGSPIANDWFAWYGSMNVKHLLSHSAGFWGGGDEDGAARMFGVNESQLTYAQDNQYILATRRLLFAPATTSDYSNHSIGLAGHVLSVASGMSFKSFIQSKILKPLGLTQIVRNGEGIASHDASPHGKDGAGYLSSTSLEPSANENGLAAGGYSATAGDMVRLMLATDRLPNHPDVLAESSLDTMEKPPFPLTVPTRALGWNCDWDASTSTVRKLGKDGDTGGGNAYIAKFQAGYKIGGVDVGGMTIAVCANGGGNSSILRGLADSVVKAAAPIPVDATYDLY